MTAIRCAYGHTGSTRFTGYSIPDPTSRQNPASLVLDSGSSETFGIAPAIEYSWKPNLGVLLGVRVIPAGHNAAATITPAVAINFVR